MNHRKILLALTMGYFFLNTFSQSAPHEISQLFFDNWKQKGLSPACQALIKTNPSRPVNDTVQARLERRLESITLRKGAFIGSEEVYSDSISPSFVKILWLVKFEKEPLFLEFTFYKPYEQWYYLSFEFDQEYNQAGNSRKPGKQPQNGGNRAELKPKGKL